MKRTSPVRAFIPLLLDIVVPVAVYYFLHCLKVPDIWSLTAAGVVSGVTAIITAVRKRKLESMSLLVLLLFALSVALLFVTRDARFLLVKPSLFIAGAAVYVFATTFRRPLLIDTVKPFATDGEPARVALWENSWETSANFRLILRTGNVAVALILLAEAIARAWIALSVPFSTGVLLTNLPGLVALLLFALIGRFYLRPAIQKALRRESVQQP